MRKSAIQASYPDSRSWRSRLLPCGTATWHGNRACPVLIAAITLSVCVGAAAQQVPSSGYRVDHFTSDEGLPGHQIYDIEQTADGYLWVTTNNALARFDGYSFTTFPDDSTFLPTGHRFSDLHLAPGDTLFVSSWLGYVVRYVNGEFTSPELKGELHTGQLARDGSGTWWAARFSDLVREGAGSWVVHSQYVLAPGEQRPFVDGAGYPWVVARQVGQFPREMVEPAGDMTPDGYLLVRLEDGRAVARGPTLYPFNVTLPARREILFSRRRGNAVEFFNLDAVIRGSYVLRDSAHPLLIDRHGYLWVDEGDSIQSYAPDATRPSAVIPIPEGGIRAWFEDREGNLWVGTALDGLIRIRQNPFGVFAAAGQTEALSITQGQGGAVYIVFAMTDDWYRLHDGRATHFMSNVRGMHEDPDGRLLFHRVVPRSVPPTEFVRRVEGRERVIGTGNGGVLYQQVYQDPSDPNVVWTHDGDTIYRIDDPFGDSPRQTAVVGELGDVRHILRSRSGWLWVATGSGLVRIDGAEVTRYTKLDGLPAERLRAVLEDEDGTLWVGSYGYGLIRYRDGVFRTITTRDGLGEDVVSSILEDDAGYLWMSGNRGVHRTKRADLNAFLDGRLDHVSSVLYGRESGLLNPEASGFAGLKGDDGLLWFPTFKGAAFVDPTLAREMESQPPIMHVTSVVVDDTVHPARGRIGLGADQRRFEIAYVGVSLRDPEGVTYRYRLNGFDEGWIDAGSSRSAVYTNVTAGTHNFEVQARSFGGIWSEVDNTLTLHVAQFFYRSWWFYVLLGFGFAGLGAIAYVRRVRTLELRQIALHALVEERTKALVEEKEVVAAQAEQLRSLDRAKSRFFANVSHEFRTPLTLILGPLEDLQEGRQGPIGDGIRRHVGTAIRNGRRLLRLVNQLLDISRLESGRLELKAQECDLGDYIARTMEVFASLAERRQISLRFDRPAEPISVFVDLEQFEKILANLLGNALKFTPEGGAVRVSLETEPTASIDSDHAVLRVSDNGPGIAPDHLAHVFERFYQVDPSSTRRQEGTGIGLALARSLVELHHGTVAVESRLGLGTTFTVRLRLGDSHLRPDEIADSDSGISESMSASAEVFADTDVADLTDDEAESTTSDDQLTTVLVVDDNAEVRHYVRGHLIHRFRVLEAADGKEALTRTRESMPDLIVSDIMMPEMNGYDLCRAIRRDPELAFLPIILLTARASTENRLVGLEEGADDYLTKPFNVRELEIRIENLLASRQRLKASLLSSGVSLVASEILPDVLAPNHASFVAQVREVVAARLPEDDFGVDTLAAILGMGRTKLYARLSEVLQTSPMDLIWRMRLERAASMLREGDGTVSEVAYGVGFKSVGHFCKRFRSEFDCSPTEFAGRSSAAID